MTLMKILVPGKMNRGTSFAAGPCGYSSKITYLFLKEPLCNGEVCLHKGELFCRSWRDNGEMSPLVSGNCIGKAVGIPLQESIWDPEGAC